jgi:hypothetical protein
MVTVWPPGVVTVEVTGAGSSTVAMEPDGVTISTEDSQDGISRVAVPPPRVSTPERTTTGDPGMVSVWPDESTMVTVDGTETDELTDELTDGELTINLEAETV